MNIVCGTSFSSGVDEAAYLEAGINEAEALDLGRRLRINAEGGVKARCFER